MLGLKQVENLIHMIHLLDSLFFLKIKKIKNINLSLSHLSKINEGFIFKQRKRKKETKKSLKNTKLNHLFCFYLSSIYLSALFSLFNSISLYNVKIDPTKVNSIVPFHSGFFLSETGLRSIRIIIIDKYP